MSSPCVSVVATPHQEVAYKPNAASRHLTISINAPRTHCNLRRCGAFGCELFALTTEIVP